jgi:hypothetical protein
MEEVEPFGEGSITPRGRGGDETTMGEESIMLRRRSGRGRLMLKGKRNILREMWRR